MNEFLHSLRAAKDKRFDRTKRNYNNPQYRDGDRRNGKDNWRSNPALMTSIEQIAVSIAESLPNLKSVLESIVDQQKQLVQIRERRATAEEKQAEALSEISCALRALNIAPTVSAAPAQVLNSETAVSAEPESGDAAAVVDSPAGDVVMKRDEVLTLIRSMREKQATFENIARTLQSMGIPTFSGKGEWRGQTVHRLHQKLMG
jgi:hypothetical protein